MKEQRGEQVSGSIVRNRQLWRSQSLETRLIAGEHVESVGRRVVELERLHDDDRWPAGARQRSPAAPLASRQFARRSAIRARRRSALRWSPRARRGRGRIRRRPRRHRSAPGVADDRIAGVGRFPIGGADALKRTQSRFPDLRLAEIAGQKAGAARRARRSRAIRRRTRRSCRRRRRGRASRRSPYDWRTARSSAARPRVRAAAAERPPPNCRHGRRRHATGWRGSAEAWPTRRRFGERVNPSQRPGGGGGAGGEEYSPEVFIAVVRSAWPRRSARRGGWTCCRSLDPAVRL